VTAASTAKANRSAAASPPMSSSLRPETSAASPAARSSSTGAVISNKLDVSRSAERARTTAAGERSISQARTLPASSGTTQL
jgi:hypothetical protein